MNELEKLLAKRSETLARAEAIAEAGQDMSGEQSAILAGLVQELKGLDARITELENLVANDATSESRSSQVAEVASAIQPQAPAKHVSPYTRSIKKGSNMDSTLRSWLKIGTELETGDDVRAVGQIGATGMTISTRAGLVSNATSGSYAVGSTLLPEFEKLLVEYCNYLEFVRVIRSKDGSPLRIAVDADQTSANATGRWVPETVVDDDKSVTLEQRTLGSFTASSNIALASYEMLEDAGVDITRLITEALASRVGRLVASAITNGTGTGEPRGWMSAVDNNALGSAKITSIPSAASGALAYDDFASAFGALPPHAQASKSCRWLMAPSTYGAILKLKDDVKRAYFQPAGEIANSPAGSIFGRPITVVPGMEELGAGKTPLLVGDFSQLIVRQVGDVLVQKTLERWFESRQVGFRALLRLDTAILDGNSFRAIKSA